MSITSDIMATSANLKCVFEIKIKSSKCRKMLFSNSHNINAHDTAIIIAQKNSLVIIALNVDSLPGFMAAASNFCNFVCLFLERR